MTDDESRESRDVLARTRARIDAIGYGPSDEELCFVCRTFAPDGTTYPAGIGVYYELRPQLVTGPETAGTSPTFADDPDAGTIPAICLGPHAPPMGSLVLCSVGRDGRWGFVY